MRGFHFQFLNEKLSHLLVVLKTPLNREILPSLDYDTAPLFVNTLEEQLAGKIAKHVKTEYSEI